MPRRTALCGFMWQLCDEEFAGDYITRNVHLIPDLINVNSTNKLRRASSCTQGQGVRKLWLKCEQDWQKMTQPCTKARSNRRAGSRCANEPSRLALTNRKSSRWRMSSKNATNAKATKSHKLWLPRNQYLELNYK